MGEGRGGLGVAVFFSCGILAKKIVDWGIEVDFHILQCSMIEKQTLFLLYCFVFNRLCNPFVYPSRYFPDIMRLFKAENALI